MNYKGIYKNLVGLVGHGKMRLPAQRSQEEQRNQCRSGRPVDDLRVPKEKV